MKSPRCLSSLHHIIFNIKKKGVRIGKVLIVPCFGFFMFFAAPFQASNVSEFCNNLISVS